MKLALINSKINRVIIEQEDDAQSPRDWDNLGKMVCFHRNYNLGDEHPKESPEDYRKALACEFDPHLEARLERKDEYWERHYPAGSYGTQRWKEWCREREQDFEEAVQRVLDQHILELPLYLYDHSGITMNTSGFSCGWDSGQVGFIYVTKAAVKKEFGWANLTKARVQKIYDRLVSEVAIYDDYLTGQVYGFKHEVADIPEDYAYLALLDPQEALDILLRQIDEDDLEWEEEEACWGFYGYDHNKSGLLGEISPEVRHLAEEAA